MHRARRSVSFRQGAPGTGMRLLQLATDRVERAGAGGRRFEKCLHGFRFAHIISLSRFRVRGSGRRFDAVRRKRGMARPFRCHAFYPD